MKLKYYEQQTFENLKLEQKKIEGGSFTECVFKRCTFENCILEECSFMECQFYECSIISPKAVDSNLIYLEFTECNLIGVHWQEFQRTGTIAVPFSLLRECTLKYNSFIKMNFRKMDFSGNSILDCIFEGCSLQESNFRGCRLEETQYSDCDMRKADFREAAGYKIDLAENKLMGAQFSFPEVISLLDGLGIRID